MNIVLRDAADLQELDRRIAAECSAIQRDRYRAVRLALDGVKTLDIADKLDRSRDFVQTWAYAYRDGGVDAIRPRPSPGRSAKLSADQQKAFIERFKQGPVEGDTVCTFRGKDAQRILRESYGVNYSLGGVYVLLHRHNLSCLKPRPRHRKNDPQAMEDFLQRAPAFVQKVKDEHPDQTVEVWAQDEARFGQQGTLTHVWADTGSRPTAVKQTEYEWLYVFAAVNPLTGESSAILTPTVNTLYMDEHLRFISEQVGPGRHVVLVLDRAGWHVAKALKVPPNITLLLLPPYSPELNPIERIWAYLKSHYLSNRVFTDYDDLFAAVRTAWLQVDEPRLQSITRTAWLTPAA